LTPYHQVRQAEADAKTYGYHLTPTQTPPRTHRRTKNKRRTLWIPLSPALASGNLEIDRDASAHATTATRRRRMRRMLLRTMRITNLRKKGTPNSPRTQTPRKQSASYATQSSSGKQNHRTPKEKKSEGVHKPALVLQTMRLRRVQR
jgi:hypothetical protein